MQRGTDGAGKNSRSRAPQGRKGEDERAHGGGHEGRQSSARSSRRQSRGQAALRDNRLGQTQPVRGPEVLPQDKVRSGVTRMFATVVPGMAQAVARELDHREGVQVSDAGFDGRSDLILFDVERGHREGLLSLRTVEDLFVEVGRTMRSSGDKSHWIAGRIWRPERVEKALSVWAAEVRPLAGTMTFRVIARVLQERSFLRTELRRALGEAIGVDKPRWRVADPSDLEVWISEYQAGRFVAGLRLSDASMRQHEGREVERPGALRPTVAALMVNLAGAPGETLLDPCCGSGTILGEALAAGWETSRGGDIAPDAVEVARRNAPGAEVIEWDVRHLPLPDASVDAVVSNLPFGRQFQVQGSMSDWLTAALAEMARVTRPGGRLVLLAPDLPRASIPRALRGESKDSLRLLGARTTLWVLRRVGNLDVAENR